jgi:hypothetical protein
MDSFIAFRKDLLSSLERLRSQYKLNILETDFAAMLQ